MKTDNAYADLVAAANQVRRADEFAPYQDFTIEQAAEFVAEHQTQLAAARQALARPCRVEVRFESAYYKEHSPETETLRRFAHLFACEGRVAANRQDFEQVIRSSLDLLTLGNAMRRGGLVLDFLIGLMGNGAGIDLLRKQRTKFSDDQRKRLIVELLHSEAESEPLATIIARDDEWEAVTKHSETESHQFTPMDPDELGMSIEDQQELHSLMQASAERERNLPPEQKRQGECGMELFHQAMSRLLVTDLALRRFQEAHRVFPNRLHLLAPKFVSAVPLDPYTNAPLIYRRHGDAFELYSTGPKQVDGGGSFTSRSMVSMHQGDLCLDVHDIPDPENVCEIAQEVARGG